MNYEIDWSDLHPKKRTPWGVRIGLWFMSLLAVIVWLWIFLALGAAIIDHYDGRVGSLAPDYIEKYLQK